MFEAFIGAYVALLVFFLLSGISPPDAADAVRECRGHGGVAVFQQQGPPFQDSTVICRDQHERTDW